VGGCCCLVGVCMVKQLAVVASRGLYRTLPVSGMGVGWVGGGVEGRMSQLVARLASAAQLYAAAYAHAPGSRQGLLGFSLQVVPPSGGGGVVVVAVLVHTRGP
jgi:hypothetical protein